MKKKYENLTVRADGSYIYDRDGMPYHVPNEGEWADLWEQVDAYAREHPEEVQVEPAPPEPTLEELREAKLAELNTAFDAVRETAWVKSSLGFKADANDTANTNVEGLLKRMTALGETSTLFCDYDNEYRPVTLENLQTLQLEIIQNGQNLYAQKWAMRNAINVATKKEALDAVVITFTMMDFSA